MALYIATDDRTTSLIAKCIPECHIVQEIQQLFGYQIGQLRYELCPQHAYNANNIVTNADIVGFEDGWVYPNGTYISQELFPDAYDMLMDLDYEDILIPGTKKTKTAKGVSDGKTYHLIQLPRFEGYFYPNTSQTSKIAHNSAKWNLKKHTHRLSFDTTDEDAQQDLTITDGAWIWSTKGAGPNESVASTDYGDVRIPLTTSVHEGALYTRVSDRNANTLLMQWDLPIKPSGDYEYNVKVNGTTGEAESSGPQSIAEKAVFQPKTLNCSILMFIGFPIM